jgi:uncharacterized NAD(P)/FAD-binding protein YdhS
MLIARHALVIGGGFSGTLLAINLLRHGSLRVTLVERDPDRLARGLAYGAAQDGHVLNVRAANMSAFADQPAHFVDWLAKRGTGSDATFATRRDYGSYLAEMLADMRRSAGERFTIVTDEVMALDLLDQGGRLRLASGSSLTGDIVILAPGNLPPHDLPAFAGLSAPAYISDPWSRDIAADLTTADHVLLLGTGLTAVDCALTLADAGFRGRITALSRRGLTPHMHAPSPSFTPIGERPPLSAAALVGAVRKRSRIVGWRNAVDELRPFTQTMWGAAHHAEKARFLRHLRPYWDVHRHRIAPPVAERLSVMKAQGRLSFMAGKIVTARPAHPGLHLSWRPRGTDDPVSLTVARVINCTGPLSDLCRTREPLLQTLWKTGAIRPDPMNIGIDVDQQARAVRNDGAVNERLFAVGPMTRGAHWEIVAVPDIRKQVFDLARRLTGAHWVEAEGL